MSAPPDPFVPPANEYEDGPPSETSEVEQRDDRADDPTPSATDERAMARQARHNRKRAQEVVEFWRQGLASEIGRRAIWELLQSSHTFEDRFACTPAGFPCPEATWFQAGEQANGMRVFMSLMKHDYLATHQMLIEHHPDFQKPKPPPRKKNDA